jgi:hypothetical protein
MLAYACTRAAGVGEKMEQAIWDAAGENWGDVDPGQIPRMTPTIHAEFVEARDSVYREKEQSEAIGWLMSLGASINMAQAAWDEWENKTIPTVERDCYRLADLPHYGFTHVDGEIRKRQGIGDTDPRRIRAALIYAHKQLTNDGSTVVSWERLHLTATAMIGGSSELITRGATDLMQSGDLVGFETDQTFAMVNDYCAEKLILEFATKTPA